MDRAACEDSEKRNPHGARLNLRARPICAFPHVRSLNDVVMFVL